MNSFCKIVFSITLLTVLYSTHVFCMDIFDAVRTDNIARVRELLDSAPVETRLALVNQQDNNGQATLHWAAGKGRAEIVRMLLNAFPETARLALVTQQDPHNRWTPLHWAAYNSSTDIVRMLLDAVPEVARLTLVNQKDNYGWTPLHFAAFNGKTEIAQMLLDAIPETARLAVVNQQTGIGATPLHWAAYNGYIDIARIFIADGARLDAQNNLGYTPAQSARANSHPEIADLIESSQQRVANVQQQAKIISLTLAQAFHHRLGAESPVAQFMPQDLLRKVMTLVVQANEQAARQPQPEPARQPEPEKAPRWCVVS